MKKIETVFSSVGFSILLTLSILLALGSTISNTLFPSAQSVPYGLRADGDPPPPFPPMPSVIRESESTVIADGDPPPPFPPLPKPPGVIRMSESVFVADGDPPPPFPRPPLGSHLGQRELRYLGVLAGEAGAV
jgi:hypothetical protein